MSVPAAVGAVPTVFRWRHRLLDGLRHVGLRLLDGVVEADETFLRRSFKGHRGWCRGSPPIDRDPRYRGFPLQLRGLSHLLAPVVTAVDRTGAEYNRVLDRRRDIVRLSEIPCIRQPNKPYPIFHFLKEPDIFPLHREIDIDR